MILAGACLMQYAQAQTIDRSHPPKPGPAPVLTIKDPVIYKMPNGITVLVVEDHRLPKVSASFSIDVRSVLSSETDDGYWFGSSNSMTL